MKKILALVLFAVLSFTLVACGAAEGDAPAGMKLACDPEIVDYVVYVPTAWEVTSSSGMTMAQAALTDTTNLIITNHSHSNTVEYRDTKNTLIAYLYGADEVKVSTDGSDTADATYREYDESLLTKEGSYLNRLYSLFDTVKDDKGNEKSSFTMIEAPTFTTLKKGDKAVVALSFVYSGTLDGATVQQRMILSYDNAYYYNITFTTAPGLYDTHKTTFNTILENFSFDS